MPHEGTHPAGVGLEDFDASDFIVPRLKVLGKKALFQDSATQQEFATIDCIILALTKQRIMWRKVVEANEKPLCKSPDFVTGFPNVNPTDPPQRQFPWRASVFNVADVQPDPAKNGHKTLDCGSCNFKDWTKDEYGQSVKPLCSEQYTLTLLYTADGGATWEQALLTFGGASIKPTKQYLGPFAQKRQSLFTAMTRISLNLQKRGDNEFSTPIFQKLGDTNQDDWGYYTDIALQSREMLHAPPRPLEVDASQVPAAPSSNVNTAPAAVAEPEPTPPAPAPQATNEPDVVDAEIEPDEPAPAAPPTPTPAASAPSVPAAPPRAPSAPAPPRAPSAAPRATQAPATPAAAPAPAPPQQSQIKTPPAGAVAAPDDSSGLPF